jgi:hypothetical protein
MPNAIERIAGTVYGFNSVKRDKIPIKSKLAPPHPNQIKCIIGIVFGRKISVALVRKKAIVATLAIVKVSSQI